MVKTAHKLVLASDCLRIVWWLELLSKDLHHLFKAKYCKYYWPASSSSTSAIFLKYSEAASTSEHSFPQGSSSSSTTLSSTSQQTGPSREVHCVSHLECSYCSAEVHTAMSQQTGWIHQCIIANNIPLRNSEVLGWNDPVTKTHTGNMTGWTQFSERLQGNQRQVQYVERINLWKTATYFWSIKSFFSFQAFTFSLFSWQLLLLCLCQNTLTWNCNCP